MVKLDIKIKPKKLRCGKCKKTNGVIKFYILPGKDTVRSYHPACYKELLAKQEKKWNQKK